MPKIEQPLSINHPVKNVHTSQKEAQIASSFKQTMQEQYVPTAHPENEHEAFYSLDDIEEVDLLDNRSLRFPIDSASEEEKQAFQSLALKDQMKIVLLMGVMKVTENAMIDHNGQVHWKVPQEKRLLHLFDGLTSEQIIKKMADFTKKKRKDGILSAGAYENYERIFKEWREAISHSSIE